MTATQFHHFFVHFPIVLLVLTALADGIALIRPAELYRRLALAFLGMAALAVVFAAVTGNTAEGILQNLGRQEITAIPALSLHVRWGNGLTWLILAVALVRIFFVLEKREATLPHWVFPSISFLLALAVLYTGLLGGHLTAAIRSLLLQIP